MQHSTDVSSNRGGTVLRDHLAGDRTVLANERTFLAYVRTALTFFVAGITFIKFFDNPLIQGIGYGFLPVAGVTLTMGMISFRRNRSHIADVVCEDSDVLIIQSGKRGAYLSKLLSKYQS